MSNLHKMFSLILLPFDAKIILTSFLLDIEPLLHFLSLEGRLLFLLLPLEGRSPSLFLPLEGGGLRWG